MKLSEIVAKFDSELEFVKQLAVEVVKLGTENPDFQYNTSERLAACHYNGPATIKTGTSSTPIQAGPDCNDKQQVFQKCYTENQDFQFPI
jgi:hypothetical protein